MHEGGGDGSGKSVVGDQSCLQPHRSLVDDPRYLDEHTLARAGRSLADSKASGKSRGTKHDLELHPGL